MKGQMVGLGEWMILIALVAVNLKAWTWRNRKQYFRQRYDAYPVVRG